MDLSGFSNFETVAIYERQASARAAVEALQKRGVDQQRVQMAAPEAKPISDAAHTGAEDREIASETGRNAAKFGAIVAGLGALVGLVLGAVLFGIGAWQTLACAAGGLLLGAGFGLTFGGVGKAMDIDAGKPGVEGDDVGRYIVGVRAGDKDDREQVTEVLRDGNPQQLHRQSPDGTLERVL